MISRSLARFSLAVLGSLACAGVLLAQSSAHPAAKAASAPAASSADQTVLTVGTQKVTARQLNAIIDHLPAQTRSEALTHKREVAEQYGKMLALVHEAERRHLDSGEDFRVQMVLTRNQALTNSLMESLRQEVKVGDADAQAYYSGHPAEFEQVRARHILVTYAGAAAGQSKRTKEEAKAKIDAIAARLKKGEDFATVAKAETEDPGSKTTGGEYTFGHGQMVAEFDKVAWSLPVGQTSDPFETRYGYHIVKVEEHKTVAFDQAKTGIVQRLTSEALQKKVETITAEAHPTVNEAYFGAQGAAAPTTTK